MDGIDRPRGQERAPVKIGLDDSHPALTTDRPP